MKLPKPRSEDWYSIFICVFLGNILATLGSRYVIQQNITAQNVFGFTILALIITAVMVVGYLGATYWAWSIIISNIVAILYLFYSVTFNISDGWTDLISLFSYLSILLIGFVVGLILQVVMFFAQGKKKKPTKK